MRVFKDTETGSLITIEELKSEYDYLVKVRGTEAECFNDYITNCTAKNGFLEEVRI